MTRYMKAEMIFGIVVVTLAFLVSRPGMSADLFNNRYAWQHSQTCDDYTIAFDNDGKIIAALPSMAMRCKAINSVMVGDTSVTGIALSPAKGNSVDYTVFWLDRKEALNWGVLPVGPKVKIITINAQGMELTPRPQLDEDDDIYIALVNLPDELMNRRFQVLYKTTPFGPISQKIFGQPSATDQADKHYAIAACPPGCVPTPPPQPRYGTQVAHLGRMTYKTLVGTGGVEVNYEIQICKPQTGNNVECEYFAGNKIPQESTTASTAEKKKEPSTPHPGDTTEGSGDKPQTEPGDTADDSRDQPQTEPGDTAEKKEDPITKINSGNALQVNNLFRFRLTAGMAYSFFNLEETENEQNVKPIVGLSCYLGNKRNQAVPPPPYISLDRWAVWFGVEAGRLDLKNTYLGLDYEFVDGADFIFGYNFRTITEHEDHDPNRSEYNDMRDAFFMSLSFNSDVFQNFWQWVSAYDLIPDPPEPTPED